MGLGDATNFNLQVKTLMSTETNYILVSGASGTGKSLWIDRFVRELKDRGYNVDWGGGFYPRRPDFTKKDWKKEVFEYIERQGSESRFCLIELISPGPMEITFHEFLGAMDLLKALEGGADPDKFGYEGEAPHNRVSTEVEGGEHGGKN
jgi:hypothetical protein